MRLKTLGKGPQWLANEVCRLYPDADPLTVGTVFALIKRNSKTTVFAARIAAALEVTIEWLSDGIEQIPSDKSADSNVLNIKPISVRDRQVQEVVALSEGISETGLAILIFKAREIAAEHPVQTKQTQS